MSLSSWKQFQFFDLIPIRDPSLGSDLTFYSDPTLSATAPINEDELVIAVQSNIIKFVNIREAKIKNEFQAFEDDFQISYLKIVDNTFLLAVAECVGKPSLIKIYKLDKLPEDGKLYHSLIEVKNKDNRFPISGISVLDDLSCIIVGYINGKVLLIRGDISRDRGSRQRIIYDDPKNEPITCVFLNHDATLCYVSTTSKVMLFNTSGRNAGQPDIIINNESGIDLNCGYYNRYTNEFIGGLKNKIEFYKESGEKSLVLYGDIDIKRLFPISEKYLLLFTEPEITNSTSLDIAKTSTTMRLLILDLTYKTVVFSSLTKSAVVDVFSVPGSKDTYYISSNGILNKLSEKPVNAQIEIAAQKEMFQFALKLASANSLTEDKVREIHKQYGDYLFNKNKLAEATEEYINAHDAVETSEIIAKLGMATDSGFKALENLAEYLWSLLKNSKAKADHITLLLVILIKLRDIKQLTYFMNHFTREGIFSKTYIETDINDETFFYSDINLFDLELIINLLEESGFVVETYELAQRFAKDPVTVVEILLEKLHNPKTALNYIKSLTIDNTLRVLVIYSKQLLEKLPNNTNALLIDVFTGKYYPNKTFKTELTPIEDSEPTDIRKVFYSYAEFFGYNANKSNKNVVDVNKKENATYHPPKPSLIFNSFLSRPFEFVVFLEACLNTYQRYGGLDYERQTLYTTLYDVYLTLSKEDIMERQDEWRNKALKILEESNKLSYEVNQTLPNTDNVSKNPDNSLMMLISHMNNIDIYSSTSKSNFFSGSYYINQFQSLIYSETPQKILEYLEEYGKEESSLYRIALRYFISSKDILAEIGGTEVLEEKVLNVIVKNDLLSLMEIIQILSINDVAEYGLIQNILINYISDNENEINNNNKLIESYKLELKEKKNRLEQLSSPNTTTKIKIKNEKCEYCKSILEMPIVYFKCGHSYHQRCLNKEHDQKSDKEIYVCPRCIADKESTEALVNNQLELRDNKEIIKLSLEDSNANRDRFKIVSEFIGRGALDQKNTNF